jgi:hypothetical protein
MPKEQIYMLIFLDWVKGMMQYGSVLKLFSPFIFSTISL